MKRLMQNRWLRPGVALLATAAVLGGCSRDNVDPVRQNQPQEQVHLAVQVSSAGAKVGDQVAVAVRINAAQPVLTMQGTFGYNPAALRYVGYDVGDGEFAMVNDEHLDTGRIPYIASGALIGMSRTPALVFEVVSTDYMNGLWFDLATAVLPKDQEVTRAVTAARPEVAGDLRVLQAPINLSVADWARRMDPKVTNQEIQFSPGQRLAGLRYGDVNLSGSFTAVDVANVAAAALGRAGFELVVGTDSVVPGSGSNNRDMVLAANVRPVGTPPGGADPNKVVNATDFQGLRSTFLAGGVDPAVGGLINTVMREADNPGCTNLVKTGTITVSETWDVARPCFVQLDGLVTIDGGATLTIAKNTLVKGNTALNPSGLFITRNARILAIGTDAEPIEFDCTAVTPSPGCWGGVWIAGNAGVNEDDGSGPSPAIPGRQTGGANQRQGEAGAPHFGGNNDADSSGVLRYLRISNAGFIIAPNRELNCLTLGGVGYGTDIDHIQCHKGSDDGVEFFGGVVDVQYMFMSNNQDDSYDFSFGYNGRTQFLMVYGDPILSDKGFEGDNTESPATYDNSPRTAPEIYNVTMLGEQTPSGTNNPASALHIRRGNSPEIGHALIANYPRLFLVDDVSTCNRVAQDTVGRYTVAQESAGDSIRLMKARVMLPGGSVHNSSSTAFPCKGMATSADLVSIAAFENDTTPGDVTTLLQDPFNFANPDLRPRPGMLLLTGKNLPPARANHINFDPSGALFIGAVAPQPLTLNNVSWYMGWTRMP